MAISFCFIGNIFVIFSYGLNTLNQDAGPKGYYVMIIIDLIVAIFLTVMDNLAYYRLKPKYVQDFRTGDMLLTGIVYSIGLSYGLLVVINGFSEADSSSLAMWIYEGLIGSLFYSVFEIIIIFLRIITSFG